MNRSKELGKPHLRTDGSSASPLWVLPVYRNDHPSVGLASEKASFNPGPSAKTLRQFTADRHWPIPAIPPGIEKQANREALQNLRINKIVKSQLNLGIKFKCHGRQNGRHHPNDHGGIQCFRMFNQQLIVNLVTTCTAIR